MNLINKEMTIGGIVAALPEAKTIFSKFGVDYCCGGNRKLADVIILQNLNEDEILGRLHEVQNDRINGYASKDEDFTEMSPSILTHYIEDTHHGYLRETLPQAAGLLNTILRVHGRNHRELFEVYRLFGILKADLEQHLLKEEAMLFPALAEADSTEAEIISLTTDIIKEHVEAGEILSKLRSITDNYSLPADACGTFQAAYELLEEIENDLHQHIHLENNILLKNYDIR